ncbi:hypothetical protein SASPL_100575 [Salvia splendens]|uniref:WAT1-related protein n=1 Tax=Salvia splendens TaxID=180675 RepID=A0A8X8YQ30_SALSN|nr:hypothetical protein SASPL_100575 [Salvia splendens]
MWKDVRAMVSVELSLSVVNILLKKAMNGGLGYVIIRSGKAKVVGTVVCIMGDLLLSLYSSSAPQHGVVGQVDPLVVRAKKFGLGAAFLGVGSVAWSLWFLMQSRIGQYFPHRYSSTLIMSLFSSFQSALLCLVTERDFSKWIVRGGLDILRNCGIRAMLCGDVLVCEATWPGFLPLRLAL